MPRKLGQHFLQNASFLRRIAEAACPGGSEAVVEIGAGRGALTAFLLERSPRIVAIEVDPAMVEALHSRFPSARGLEILPADILTVDLAPLLPAVITGNLPYYITSPILFKVLGHTGRFPRAVFLVQREVADRLGAKPGSRDYGYLTVHTQLLAEVRVLFGVPRGAFSPAPKVDSAVVELTPRLPAATPASEAFLRFAAACFRQKRKTLRNNLQDDWPAIRGFPEARLRAEQLAVEELLELYERLRESRQDAAFSGHPEAPPPARRV